MPDGKPAGPEGVDDDALMDLDHETGFPHDFHGIPISRPSDTHLRDGFEPGAVHQLLWVNDCSNDNGPPDEMESILRIIDMHPITALGRRPADYRVRDMMHGSCFRIPRM